MDQANLEQAVEVALNHNTSIEIRQQALNYLQGVRDSQDAWQVCLPLFARSPRASETVRVVMLDMLASSVERRFGNPADESTLYIKEAMQEYIRESYSANASGSDSGPVQAKICQLLTKLFIATYTSSWESFFDDLMTMGKGSAGGAWDNPQGIQLFIRTCASIHDEVADTLIPRTPEEGARNTDIKDRIRERDMNKIVASWREIMTEWGSKQCPIVEMCLHVIARWISWIDISLVVNDVMMRLLFQFMGSEGSSRDAALVALNEIIGKKMKGPDKLDLIVFLNVGEIVQQIAQSPSLQNQESLEYDTDLAEGAAKLINTAALDVVMIMKEGNDEQQQQRSENLLQSFMPLILRFFSDQYDEVSSAVFPVTTELFNLFRKEKKMNGGLIESHSALLPPILNAIVMKTRYDSDATWGDEDEQTDEAEFEHLKQRLRTMQDSVSLLDESLFIEFMTQLVESTFDRIHEGGVDWRDLDLALYELYTFVEIINRKGGMFSKGKPSSLAGERLTSMLAKMFVCNVADYSHPATKLKSMEIFARYTAFFEVHTNFIPQALESFNKCIHDDHVRVRNRSWYLFYRFVRALRQNMGDVAEPIIGAIGDLLVLRAEVPTTTESPDSDEISSEDEEDMTFESQLYLFEAVGFLCSAPSVTPEKQALMVKSIMSPLFSDLEAHLGSAESGEFKAILQIHHDIMALGSLGKGFSNWNGSSLVGGNGSEPTTNRLVMEEFTRATEAVLVALERLNRHPAIRIAVRLAFSRIIGVLGPNILEFLPRWITGLLTKRSSKGELSSFLKLLEQILHGFKNVVYDILNELLAPLLQRVFKSLGEPISGTDEEVDLQNLRRGFLSFLLVIINNDLSQVFVSEANREQFQSLLEAIRHYARENTDVSTQRSAINILNKLSFVFGPSSAALNEKAKASGLVMTNAPQEQPLAGFEDLMNGQFALMCWEIIATPGFNCKEANSKQVLIEIATLQKMLYLKLGDAYLQTLKGAIFPQIGVSRGVDEYCAALQSMDTKNFKKFFQKFTQEVLSCR